MANEPWALEIVKGKEIGRIFPVGAGPIVLGNAINGEPGIDLGSQEGTSPRKMAARQAKLERTPNGLTLSDLDSPGGTFVNRQRILSGQTRKLEPGDIVQLAGVQLKVVKQASGWPGSGTPAPGLHAVLGTRGPEYRTPATLDERAKPGSYLTTPYTMADGSICRSWDDFLLASSKSWTALRGELTSGKLETFLRSNGHPGLLPPGAGSSTSDERLDAWLGSLPTTRPSLPELDIHPTNFRVKATPGGGQTRVKLSVTNVGYRLLRSKLRIEPANAGILAIAAEWTAKPFTTAEHTEVPIDVVIPDAVSSPISAFLVVESNGGERRVEVKIEPVSTSRMVESATTVEPAEGLLDFLASWSRVKRVAFAAAIAFGLRVVLSIIDGVMTSTTPRESFVSSILVFTLIGLILGAIQGVRKAGMTALVPAGVASGIAFVFVATVLQAMRQAIDAPLGSASLVACVVWTLLGVGLAVLSCWWIPPRAMPLPEVK